jgi:hypothetical protein
MRIIVWSTARVNLDQVGIPGVGWLHMQTEGTSGPRTELEGEPCFTPTNYSV